jgi:hypothetical protein
VGRLRLTTRAQRLYSVSLKAVETLVRSLVTDQRTGYDGGTTYDWVREVNAASVAWDHVIQHHVTNRWAQCRDLSSRSSTLVVLWDSLVYINPP